ncbi:MAG: rRNA maturation RNase YbeY [Sulfurimonas sp.]|nr:MAG: rRNA maturation RNase YbeY [Sulfurimonas sp.]
MIDFDNRTDYHVAIDALTPIVDALTTADIELILTNDADISRINGEFRGIAKATDVLSFPYESMPMSPLGSIVISLDAVHRASNTLGHTFEEELLLLLIHGLLHLMGYDHETDRGEMRREEARLIAQFELPKSLIIRNEEL